MTQPEVTLYVGVLTALIALAVAGITARVSVINERKRRRDARRLDDLKELRGWVAEVFIHLYVIQHETEWLTWHAARASEAVDTKMLRNYHAATHAALPKVLGSLAIVASVDLELFKRLNQVADDLYTFEGTVAMAALTVPHEQALSRLATLNKKAHDYYESLPLALAEAMKIAKVNGQPT